MKTRPILFSAPMVRALLAGTKTKTRRIVKPQPTNPKPTCDEHIWSDTNDPVTRYFACPYGQPGDRLWVRETWCQMHDQEGRDIAFRADDWAECPADKWRPSIFMPRWASRITLEITAVRVERIQSITEADATAEGTPAIETKGEMQSDGTIKPLTLSARFLYQDLWKRINGPKSWDLNPWVWVITFRRL